MIVTEAEAAAHFCVKTTPVKGTPFILADIGGSYSTK